MQTQFQKISQKSSIDTQRLIGNGSTGDVYEGLITTSEGHQSVAIKTIHLKTIDNEVTQYLLSCQLQALKCLKQESNPYVVKLKQIVVLQDVCYIVMEKLNGGTLRDFMNAYPTGISENCSFQIFTKIIQGYKALHKNGIIHRDLKPQNIIFRSKNYKQPCIIDFGYCIVPKVTKIPQMYYNVGSPRYMAPEAYKNNKYSEKTDIWAMGTILYQMLFRTTLDKGQKISECHQKLMKQGIPYPSEFSKEFRTFINLLLTYDQEKRINFMNLEKEIKAFNSYRLNKRYRSQSGGSPIQATDINNFQKLSNHASQKKHTTQIPNLQMFESNKPALINFGPMKFSLIETENKDQRQFYSQSHKYFINDQKMPKRLMKNMPINTLYQSVYHQPIQTKYHPKIHNILNNKINDKMFNSNRVPHSNITNSINITHSKMTNSGNLTILQNRTLIKPNPIENSNHYEFLKHSINKHNTSHPQISLLKNSQTLVFESQVVKPNSQPRINIQFKTQQGFKQQFMERQENADLNQLNNNHNPYLFNRIPSNQNIIESKPIQYIFQEKIGNRTQQAINFKTIVQINNSYSNYNGDNNPNNFISQKRKILVENSAPFRQYYPQNNIQTTIKKQKLLNPMTQMILKKPFLGPSNRLFK